MANNKDWSLFGNLIYHPIGGAVTASKRFFYFSSLNGSYNRNNNPQYSVEANKIGAAAQAALSSGLGTADNQSGVIDWNQKYNQIIEFLQHAVAQEQANEQTYFSQKLALFKSNFTAEEIASSPELKEIERLLSGGGKNFDYIAFIAVLNILLQGLDNTKELFKYELDRLGTMANGISEMRKNRENQLKGYFKDLDPTQQAQKIQAGMQKFDSQRRSIYLDRKNLNKLHGKKINLEKVAPTSDVAIGHWITDIINRVFNSKEFRATAVAQIKKCGYSTSQAEAVLKPILIKSITSYGIRHMKEILNGEIYKKHTRDLLHELTADIDFNMNLHMEGYYDNFGQFGKHIDYFKNGLQGILNGTQGASELFEVISTLEKNMKEYEKNSKEKAEGEAVLKILGKGQIGSKNVSKQVADITRFENAIKQLENLAKKQIAAAQANKQIKKNILGANTQINLGESKIDVHIDKDGKVTINNTQGSSNELIKELYKGQTTDPHKFIKQAKTKISRKIKNKLDEAIKSYSGKEQQKLYELLEKTIQGLQLSVGGPTLSEIKLGIQSALISETGSNLVWSGKINLKNDFYEIFTPGINDDFSDELTDFQQQELIDLMEEMQAIIEVEQQEATEIFVDNIQTTSKNFAKTKQFENYELYMKLFLDNYNLYLSKEQQVNDKLNSVIQQFLSTQQSIQDQELLGKILAAKKKGFLTSLKNTMLISSTMKTYNDYQNDIGFIGGSLGATAMQQIDNLNQLFTAAGMPMETAEIEWLKFAIINCSPVSVVGEKNKDIIENYLGSMAVFALFDEAGAEMTLFNQQLSKQVESTISTPSILHLYGLNGIYYPGSFVLSQVLDGVLLMNNIINEGTINQEIHNGVTITNNTNFGMIPNKGAAKPSDTAPWQTVSKKAEANTKIQITFMAGLLSILANLNAAMNNVILPA